MRTPSVSAVVAVLMVLVVATRGDGPNADHTGTFSGGTISFYFVDTGADRRQTYLVSCSLGLPHG